MRSTWTRSLIGWVVVALCLGTVVAAKKDKDSKGDKDEPPEWDVAAPPGDWKTVTIDTTETTWSEVDVSSDGKTILFDMLGDIYTVPMAGGTPRP